MATEFQYDPYKLSVAGFVSDLRAKRQKRAAKLKEWRREIRATTSFSPIIVNLIVRPTRQFQRADDRSLREFARSNWEYANNDYGFGRGSNEYYTACGNDDYVAEKKDHARSLALEIWRTIGRF